MWWTTIKSAKWGEAYVDTVWAEGKQSTQAGLQSDTTVQHHQNKGALCQLNANIWVWHCTLLEWYTRKQSYHERKAHQTAAAREKYFTNKYGIAKIGFPDARHRYMVRSRGVLLHVYTYEFTGPAMREETGSSHVAVNANHKFWPHRLSFIAGDISHCL